MNIIKQNPFRILGLTANATEKELKKQIGIIKRYAEVGRTKSFDYDFEFIGNFTRNINEIQQASNSIEQAQKKLIYSLFWFVKNNQFDEIAFNNLKENDIDKAIEIWNKTLKEEITIKNYSSYQNLSTLYLALSTIDNQIELQKLQAGISLKGKLINSENLKDLSKLVTGNGVSINMVDISKKFVDEVIELLKPYLNKTNGISTSDLVSLFNTFPSNIQKYVLSKFTEVPIAAIENKIEKTTRKRKNNPRNAEEYGEELYISTKQDITLLQKLMGSSNVQFQMITNKLANELLQCSIDFFNTLRDGGSEFDPGDDALKVAKYAKSVGATGQTKSRIEENIAILQKWVDSKEERNLNDKIGEPAQYIINKIELAAKTLKRKGKYPKGYDDPYSELPLNEQPHNKTSDKNDNLFSTSKEHTWVDDYLNNNPLKDNKPFNINLFRLARDIVKNCKPKLDIIKDVVGEHHNVYQNLSNELASIALACLIEYVNNSGNPQLGIPPHVDEHVINAMNSIGTLWMTSELRQRYNTQKESLNKLKRNVQRASSSSLSSSGSCYIATMAYGSYDHPKVKILRKFRDDTLAASLLGRSFISFYYATSPHLVKLLKNQKHINKLIRNILDKFINKLKS